MATDPIKPMTRTLRERVKSLIPVPILLRLSRLKFKLQSNRRTFSKFYETNHWGDAESVSGAGSRVEVTEVVRARIPQLIEDLDLRVFLDAPCGDLNWIHLVDFGACRYIGADVVPELIEHNRRNFAAATREFLCLDICEEPLPVADLMLCRDCLVHLSYARIGRYVENLKRSPIKWLLTTTYTEVDTNMDIQTGRHRPINLTRPPFGWPQPEVVVREGAEGSKSLGLWRVAQIPGVQR